MIPSEYKAFVDQASAMDDESLKFAAMKQVRIFGEGVRAGASGCEWESMRLRLARRRQS